MNRVAPASPIVDLSHGVPPLDVRGGAVLLVDSLPYLGLGRAERVATYSDVESGDWGRHRRSTRMAARHTWQPGNAPEGLGSVSPGDPIWLTATRD